MAQWRCLPSTDEGLSTLWYLGVAGDGVWRGIQGAEAQRDREPGNRGREAAVVIEVRNTGYGRSEWGPRAEGEAPRTLSWRRNSH